MSGGHAAGNNPGRLFIAGRHARRNLDETISLQIFRQLKHCAEQSRLGWAREKVRAQRGTLEGRQLMNNWIVEFGIATAFITTLAAVATGLCAHSLFGVVAPLI
jgi:hypothetical protein